MPASVPKGGALRTPGRHRLYRRQEHPRRQVRLFHQFFKSYNRDGLLADLGKKFEGNNLSFKPTLLPGQPQQH